MVNNCEELIPYDGPEQGSRWTLVFDGASHALGNGTGTVIISPKGYHMLFTTRIYFDCTNNMDKYEACLMGIKVAIDMKIKFLDIYWNSALVISQIKGERYMKHPNLILIRSMY